MSKITKKQIQYIDEYQKANNDKILLKPKKEDKIIAQIQIAIDRGIAKNRQSYIIEAIKERLAKDGISVEMVNAKEEQEQNEEE